MEFIKSSNKKELDNQRERSQGKNAEVKALLVTFPSLCIYIFFWVTTKALKRAVMCWRSPGRSARELELGPEPLLPCWDMQSPLFWSLQCQHSLSCKDGCHSWCRLLGLTTFTCMKWKGFKAGAWIKWFTALWTNVLFYLFITRGR